MRETFDTRFILRAPTSLLHQARLKAEEEGISVSELVRRAVRREVGVQER